MSLAGKLSSRGDEYQLLIAMTWLVQMLRDPDIKFLQAESTGIPDSQGKVVVDDVIVAFGNSETLFIQAKKNEPNYTSWRFNSAVLKPELVKARDQLEQSSGCTVRIYSETPFGNLQKLSDRTRLFPTYADFHRDAPQNIQGFLVLLSRIVDRTLKEAFELARRITYQVVSFEDQDRRNLQDLDKEMANAACAKDTLERYLVKHAVSQAGLPSKLTREDVVGHLADKGYVLAPQRDVKEIMDAFQSASAIGRPWIREIDGTKIVFPELEGILEHLASGDGNVLITGAPGCGKTCLLLDLVEHVEEHRPQWGLLLIKGDRFCEAVTERDLATAGLPEQIVEQCARLAEDRKTVVVIDSLDVLALSRSHGAFRTFLGLIDRLVGIPNLSVVVACREFDLKYDPELRRRDWGKQVKIEPLDFDEVVVPFLQRWDIDVAAVDERLKELLRVPHNLHVFSVVSRTPGATGVRTAWDLHERYIDEVVGKDPLLGAEAIALLSDFADQLMDARVSALPKAFVPKSDLVHRLVSQNVLVELDGGSVGFAHQTLAERFAVRGALSRGECLAEYLKAQAPLPFIRPVARVYFFTLRELDVHGFRRQMRAVMQDEDIAYHLKRLFAESLAELIPADADWPMLRWLYQEHPDLFARFLQGVRGREWFNLLVDNWLPLAKSGQEWPEQRHVWARKLTSWIKVDPERVIALWHELLVESDWDAQLEFPVIMGLDQLEQWDVGGLRELLEALVETSERERDFLAKPLSKWVDATGQGDDLLWRYIVKNVPDDSTSRHGLSQGLRCQSHVFFKKEFLSERLCASSRLLDLALGWLLDWSEARGGSSSQHTLIDHLLDYTSWGTIHDEGLRSHEALHELLEGVELSVKAHAEANDQWWQANESQLRQCLEEGILYILLQGYLANPEQNIDGIEELIQHKELFRYGQMEYELGQLMNQTYPLLSEEGGQASQEMILSLYSEEDFDELSVEFVNRKKYNYLVWIPCIYRIPTAKEHIDSWRRRFGYQHPEAGVWTRGGIVRSPISQDSMRNLSPAALAKLFQYYADHPKDEDFRRAFLVGGCDMVERTANEAAAIDPVSFVKIVPHIKKTSSATRFVGKIYGGIARHVRYRFGNLNSSKEWNPVEPLPDPENLRQMLWEGLSGSESLWQDTDEVAEVLLALAEILADKEMAKRLFAYHLQLRASLPALDDQDGSAYRWRDAAEALIRLVNACAVKVWSIPQQIIDLLLEYAQCPGGEVQEWLVHYLPVTIERLPEVGWRCFEEAIVLLPLDKWRHAYACFYYNYRGRFSQVLPYMMLATEKGEGDVVKDAGKILTLMYLSEQLSQDDWASQVFGSGKEVRVGAASVLAFNIDKPDCARRCVNGLLALLEGEEFSDSLLSTVAGVFDEGKKAIHAYPKVVFAYLRGVGHSSGLVGMYRFLKWLPGQVRMHPTLALEYLEVFARTIESRGKDESLHVPSDYISSALNVLLAEADESNDPAMITRVISLQDHLLRLGVGGIEELYDNYN